MDKVEMERQQAVQRYQRGESATEISASLGRSVRWLYKWVERAESEGEDLHAEEVGFVDVL